MHSSSGQASPPAVALQVMAGAQPPPPTRALTRHGSDRGAPREPATELPAVKFLVFGKLLGGRHTEGEEPATELPASQGGAAAAPSLGSPEPPLPEDREPEAKRRRRRKGPDATTDGKQFSKMLAIRLEPLALRQVAGECLVQLEGADLGPSPGVPSTSIPRTRAESEGNSRSGSPRRITGIIIEDSEGEGSADPNR